jgi:hypothetical protein
LASKTLWRVLTQDGIWHRIIFGKYITPLSLACWLRLPVICTNSASPIWRSLLKNLTYIHHWLCWKPGSRLAIHIGRDAILGLGSKAYLSSGLLEFLRNLKVFFLFQAQHNSDCGFSCTNWKSSTDLGLSGALAQEWTSYCLALSGAGIRLHAVEDTIKWNGGDCSGLLTVKNVYNAISSTIWSQRCTGWRKNLWHWSLPLKLKLFIWLAANDKILTWDILLHRGWMGPNMCFLCHNNSETISHIFLDCPFTKSIWHKIFLVLNLKKMWTGTNLHDFLENWSLQDFTLPHLPVIVCWFVWLTRNRAIFENLTTPKTLFVSESWVS